ncbi:DMT family transporter [Candidatus Bipolaricaulota sp. J31]
MKILDEGYREALLAAALFALSVPLSKLLLREVDPLVLGGFLYLGAGLAMGFSLLVGLRGEARLRKDDLPWLLGATISGGILAPLALLYGLRLAPAATASALLNAEAAATALLAAWLFREFVGRMAWTGVISIVAGSAILGVPWEGNWGLTVGTVLVLAATVLWGLDNNLTRYISLRDPRGIAAFKGLVAGSFSISLAAALGHRLPGIRAIVSALLLGGISYGASISLFVRALRHLGAARTGALFGTAPFLGVVFSSLIFWDLPSAAFFMALPLLAAGTALLLAEEHEHLHVHEPLLHEHLHQHDDGHHGHGHPEPVPARHSHLHRHERLVHAHPHRPDIHHRHPHPSGVGARR